MIAHRLLTVRSQVQNGNFSLLSRAQRAYNITFKACRQQKKKTLIILLCVPIQHDRKLDVRKVVFFNIICNFGYSL